MPEHRVVVELNFGVERDQFAVASDDQRIDFEQGSVKFEKGAVNGLEKLNGCADHFRRKAEAKGEFARVICLKARCRVDTLTDDSVGILLGNFLDFHAAGRARHENGRADRAIDEQAEVKLALNVESFFDEQSANDAALFAG